MNAQSNKKAQASDTNIKNQSLQGNSSLGQENKNDTNQQSSISAKQNTQDLNSNQKGQNIENQTKQPQNNTQDPNLINQNKTPAEEKMAVDSKIRNDKLNYGIDDEDDNMNNGFITEGEPTKPENDPSLVIFKLKNQNEKLKGQIKELNEKLTETLEKYKNKKLTPKREKKELKDETLRNELLNSQKQIAIYQKEISNLKSRLESLQSGDKVSKLENMIKEKEKMADKLNLENRELEKVKRDNEKSIERLQNDEEFITRINQYEEEIKTLKSHIQELKKTQQHEEKSFKKQQEFMGTLEQKYREACTKAGIQPIISNNKSGSENASAQNNQGSNTVNQKSGASQHQQIQNGTTTSTNSKSSGNASPKTGSTQENKLNGGKNAKNRNQSTENDEEIDPKDVTVEKMKELMKSIKILQKSNAVLEKKYKIEMENANQTIDENDHQLAEINEKIKEKEKESQMLTQKLNELKRLTKHNLLEPLDKNLIVEKTIPKSKSPFHSKDNHKREIGGRYALNIYEQDDKEAMSNWLENKISRILFWYDEEYIYGFQAFYNNNKIDHVGKVHLNTYLKDRIKTSFIEIGMDDEIKTIQGRYSHSIRYLKFVTVKGVVKEFGNSEEPPNLNLKKFEINFNVPHERASMIFAGLATKKGLSNHNDLALAYIGFYYGKIEEIPEIIGGERTNKKLLAANRKSQSNLDDPKISLESSSTKGNNIIGSNNTNSSKVENAGSSNKNSSALNQKSEISNNHSNSTGNNSINGLINKVENAAINKVEKTAINKIENTGSLNKNGSTTNMSNNNQNATNNNNINNTSTTNIPNNNQNTTGNNNSNTSSLNKNSSSTNMTNNNPNTLSNNNPNATGNNNLNSGATNKNNGTVNQKT